MTRDFDLGDILSITADCLCSPRHVEGLYDILDYMTGDALMTHQLPRAAEACAPALIAQQPQLGAITPPIWDETGDVKEQVFAWLDEMKMQYGMELPVRPLDEWHHMDPIQELVERTETPARIMVVDTSSR